MRLSKGVLLGDEVHDYQDRTRLYNTGSVVRHRRSARPDPRQHDAHALRVRRLPVHAHGHVDQSSRVRRRQPAIDAAPA